MSADKLRPDLVGGGYLNIKEVIPNPPYGAATTYEPKLDRLGQKRLKKQNARDIAAAKRINNPK